jgi:hypothetical protein
MGPEVEVDAKLSPGAGTEFGRNSEKIVVNIHLMKSMDDDETNHQEGTPNSKVLLIRDVEEILKSRSSLHLMRVVKSG